MVSIEFWRGKLSRPATGYECIAHAPAFDRGVARMSMASDRHLRSTKVIRSPYPRGNNGVTGGHVTSRDQGLYFNDQWRKRRETLGTRLREELQRRTALTKRTIFNSLPRM